ncbi:MAG: methyltransferase domain-containing protein [Candidatus Pacebacteria bacterium]|nr:methyltransferase domain-containing protein [Candidatus Paceibacterota bacterium]
MRKLILKVLGSEIVRNILYSPFLDYHQWALLRFVKREAKKIANNSEIIDIGAGELKYKKYFMHCKYTSNDLCIGDKEWYFDDIDIKSTAYQIPVPSESFDYILCTQVLEHLDFPDKAFAEFNRILKKGGKLLLTAPLGQGEHQIPYDYFRYTKYGLKKIGERNNFLLKYIEPQGGIFINLQYILWQSKNIFLPFMNIKIIAYVYYIFFLPFKFVSGIIFIILDQFDRKKDYTNNYNCVYEKNS